MRLTCFYLATHNSQLHVSFPSIAEVLRSNTLFVPSMWLFCKSFIGQEYNYNKDNQISVTKEM